MTSGHPSLGVTFPPLETWREVLVEAAVRAEQLGYDAFFVAEAWGLDALALLAEIATRTRRILIGSAIVNVWSRSAATLAMAAATLAEISGGRFILGLGASTPQLVEGLHDVTFASPQAQLRRVVTQVRNLLQGERVRLSAGNDSRPLRLGVGPAAVPVYLAALTPGSVRLTGEIADGWMPFFIPLSHIEERAKLLSEGSLRGEACRICPIVGAAVGEDPAVAREGAAWWSPSISPPWGRSTPGRWSSSDTVPRWPPSSPPTRPARPPWYHPKLRVYSKNSSCSGRRLPPVSAWPDGPAPVLGS
jgi:alkanesulfonate monooxygenase SsuD/methylene tetrahydromethanopterin reductase-like flavin-dependent oxidoreductase (luciferase family)